MVLAYERRPIWTFRSFSSANSAYKRHLNAERTAYPKCPEVMMQYLPGPPVHVPHDYNCMWNR